MITLNPKLYPSITLSLASYRHSPPLLRTALTQDQPLTLPLLFHLKKSQLCLIPFLLNLLLLISFQRHFLYPALVFSHFSYPVLPICPSHKESFPLCSRWLRLHLFSKNLDFLLLIRPTFALSQTWIIISKILERLFLSHLLPHINSSSNFNSFQSA